MAPILAVALAATAPRTTQSLASAPQRWSPRVARCRRLPRFFPVSSLREALAICRDLGNRLGEAEVLNNLGRLLCGSSSPAEGYACYLDALEIARALSAPLEEARALEGIGGYFLQQQRIGEAVASLREALAVYRRLGSPDATRVQAALSGHSF
jgi:tetratricopeptide (TPR) repeat protein